MNSFETWGSTLLPTIELLATLAFALSGIMEAARKRMDVVGVCVVGFLAAFDGGTLRDILLAAADAEPWFCMSVFALATIAFRALAIVNNWVLPAWRKE